MLPKFKSYDEIAQFAERLFNLLTSDERVSSMLGADKKDWPGKLVDHELEKNRGEHNDDPTPADELCTFMDCGAALLDDLRLAMQPRNNHGWIDRAIQEVDRIFVSFGMTGAPESQKPQDLVQNYLNTFGKGQVGQPAMNFIMGFAQAFENASLNILTELPEMAEDAQAHAELEALDSEVQKGQQLFTELCEKNKVPFTRDVDNALNSAQKDLEANQSKLMKATANAAKYSKQLDGVDAEKLMREYQQASDAYKQEKKKYDDACDDTRSTQDAIDSLNKKNKEITDKREENRRSLAEYNSKNEQARLQYSSNEAKITKVKADFDKLSKDNPKLEQAVDLYNHSDRSLAVLKNTAKTLANAFQNTDRANNFTNLLWNVNNKTISDSSVSYEERKLIECYQNAKKQLLDTMYPKKCDERTQLENALNSKEYSTRTNNAALAMIAPEGELTKAIEKMERTMDGLQYVTNLKEGLELKEQYRKLQSEQELLKKQINANDSEIAIIKLSEEVLDGNVKELDDSCFFRCRACGVKPEECQPEDGEPMHFKEFMERAEKHLSGKKAIENQLAEKLEPLKKVYVEKKNSVETIKLSAENLEKLKAAKDGITRYEKKVQIYSELKNVKDQTLSKMEEKNALLRYSKASQLLKKDSAKRVPFYKAARSLSRRIPKVAGEANSEHYTGMQEALEKFTTVMSDSSYSPKERKDALENLGKAAKDYMAAKDKQWRPFATEKRRTRLQAAKDIAAFCEAAKPALERLPSVKAELARQIGTANMNANPRDLAKAEFSKIMRTKDELARTNREQENASKVKQTEKAKTNTAAKEAGGLGAKGK